jgi:hypothetical protein
MPRQSPELSCVPGLPPATPAVATSQFSGVQLWYANGRWYPACVYACAPQSVSQCHCSVDD